MNICFKTKKESYSWSAFLECSTYQTVSLSSLWYTDNNPLKDWNSCWTVSWSWSYIWSESWSLSYTESWNLSPSWMWNTSKFGKNKMKSRTG